VQGLHYAIVMAEETAGGRRQPKKDVTLARQRMIRNVADMLADPG